MGAYRENLKYRVYDQYKIPIFSGGGGDAPILSPLECVLHTLPEVLPLRQYTGSASGPYQSKTATSGPALHIILCTDTCIHAHTEMDTCMDGCTHNVSWIAGDKWRMIARMSFTSDCNLRDVFSKWSPVYMQTHAQEHTRTETQTHAWMWNSLKSLSHEVVTSAALFTRLMPCCTQERVNQARGYTRRPEPCRTREFLE